MFFKRFIACCIAVFIATAALLIFSEPTSTSLTKLPFLDEAALSLFILVAFYFGYSRTFFVGLMLIIPATHSLVLNVLPNLSSWLEPKTMTLAIITSSAWLLWQNDKGFRVKNSLLVIVQIVLASLFVVTLSRYILPPVINLTTLLSQIGIQYELDTNNLILITWALVVTGLIRSLLKPSYTNVSILTMMLALAIATSWSLFINGGLLTGFNTILALLLTVGLLIESRQMAFRDQLTEIPSRMALQQYVGTLGARYVVVMADIDHFKKFNDTHGHDIGDQVLKLVAKKIYDVTGGGKAFRYGGEEFTIIFADKQVHQVLPFIEQVRTSVENYPLILRSKDRPKKKPDRKSKNVIKRKSTEKKVYVTASFGVAEVMDKSQGFEQVMKQADNALYKAKKAGRNCVKTA